MPTFDTVLPTTILMDAAALSVGGSLLGMTRGGCRIDFGEEYQNIDFDGKRAPVALLDRKIANTAKIATRMIQANLALLATYLNHGGIAGMASLSVAAAAALSVAQAATYSAYADGVPMLMSQPLTIGQYLVNLRATHKRGDGATAYINFPLARCTVASLAGGDKDAAEFDVEFEARQDLTSLTDTDVAPWALVIVTS